MMFSSTMRKAAFAAAASFSLLAFWLPGAAKGQSLEEMAVIAIELGQDDLLQRAIERGANVNGRAGELSLLGHAVRLDRMSAATLLVRRGADINLATGPANQQRSPLAIALDAGRRDGDRFGAALGLLRLGADPKTMESLAARTAIDTGNLTLYQAVLSAGGSPADTGPNGISVFHFVVDAASDAMRRALSSCSSAEIDHVRTLMKMLDVSLTEGAELNRPINGMPLMSFVLSNGLFEFADAMIRSGVSPVQAGADNRRPIQVAYAFALPADPCRNNARQLSVAEVTAAQLFRAEVAAAQQRMVERLLRAMLQQ